MSDRRNRPANRWGCKPMEDVCVEHDEPLVCRHGCEQAKVHQCVDAEQQIKKPAMQRLHQSDILEAIHLLLCKRGVVPEGVDYGYLRWKFGIVGEPTMMMLGPEVPNMGHVYLDWSYEPLQNVKDIRRGSR